MFEIIVVDTTLLKNQYMCAIIEYLVVRFSTGNPVFNGFSHRHVYWVPPRLLILLVFPIATFIRTATFIRQLRVVLAGKLKTKMFHFG